MIIGTFDLEHAYKILEKVITKDIKDNFWVKDFYTDTYKPETWYDYEIHGIPSNSYTIELNNKKNAQAMEEELNDPICREDGLANVELDEQLDIEVKAIPNTVVRDKNYIHIIVDFVVTEAGLYSDKVYE